LSDKVAQLCCVSDIGLREHYIKSSWMTTGNTIEEFDDVGKVHAVINDDFSVVFDEGESYK